VNDVTHTAAKLVWEGFVRAWHDQISRHAAAVAYYAVFAAAPLLLVGTKIMSWAVGPKEANRDFGRGLHQLFGEVPARAVEDVLRRALSRPPGSVWVTVAEVAAILYAVGRLFVVVQDAMNLIWRVRPMRGWTIRNTLRDRWLSFLMVALAGPMLLAGLTLSALLAAGARHVAHEWWLRRLLGDASSLLVLTLVIACLFRLLPDVRIKWSEIWVGAAVSAALLVGGQVLTGRYLAHILGYSFNGVVGSLAVVLIWIYFCAIILFFGAEFTYVYCRWLGHEIKPAPHAVQISEQDLARGGISSTDFFSQIAEEQAKP
jgi:membrane protein